LYRGPCTPRDGWSWSPTLVTDPETLLPWRYTCTRKLRLVFAGGGMSVDQVERRELEYQWWKG
jgi:hypothetical protein